MGESACRYWFYGGTQPKLIQVGVDVCIHPIWYPIKTILVVFRTEKLAVAFVPTQILTKSSDTTFKTW